MAKFATVAQLNAVDGGDVDEAYQKCVAFSADGQHVITGGSDGHVKMFKVGVLVRYSLFIFMWEVLQD